MPHLPNWTGSSDLLNVEEEPTERTCSYKTLLVCCQEQRMITIDGKDLRPVLFGPRTHCPT